MSDEDLVRVVKVDQTFVINLEAMPGAGYMWEITRHSNEVSLISDEVVTFSREIGGQSTQQFLLVARSPGDFSVEFSLGRRWEKRAVRKIEFIIQAN